MLLSCAQAGRPGCSPSVVTPGAMQQAGYDICPPPPSGPINYFHSFVGCTVLLLLAEVREMLAPSSTQWLHSGAALPEMRLGKRAMVGCCTVHHSPARSQPAQLSVLSTVCKCRLRRWMVLGVGSQRALRRELPGAPLCSCAGVLPKVPPATRIRPPRYREGLAFPDASSAALALRGLAGILEVGYRKNTNS
jgi:hypothetical protein